MLDKREVPATCLARSKKNRSNVYPRRDQLRLLKSIDEEKFGDGVSSLSPMVHVVVANLNSEGGMWLFHAMCRLTQLNKCVCFQMALICAKPTCFILVFTNPN